MAYTGTVMGPQSTTREKKTRLGSKYISEINHCEY